MGINDYINIPYHAPPTDNLPPYDDTSIVNQISNTANHVPFTINFNKDAPTQRIANNIPCLNNINNKSNAEFDHYNDIINALADEANYNFINAIAINGVITNVDIIKFGPVNDPNVYNDYNANDNSFDIFNDFGHDFWICT